MGAQCHGVDTGLPAQLPHSTKDGRAGRVGRTASGCDAQAVSEGRRGWDSPFDPGARSTPEHLMLWSGKWARHHEAGAASSEAEIAQGGARTTSEAENRPRGR
jgi:hypothetical protein